MKAFIRLMVVGLACLAFLSTPKSSHAIVISTTGTATLGGLTFRNGDLARHTVTGTTLFFNEDNFSNSAADIDALHVRDNGNLILSTDGPATLGGLSFRNGDLVEYNPTTDSATLFFNQDLFSSDEDIDAVSILSNGQIVLSTSGSATLGGLTFNDGDLAAYNPVSGIAAFFFSESNFSISEDIDAVHVTDSGTILLSTRWVV